MIMFAIKCDHPDCDAQGPAADTEQWARRDVLAAGWQRWRDPGEELQDLCPEHHQPVKANIVYETP